MVPEPLIAPDSVRGEDATPLFRSNRLLAPSVQVPVLTTGVLVSAAKLIPSPLIVLTAKLFGSVTVAPPEAKKGAKPPTAVSMVMGPVPNAAPLLKWTSVAVDVKSVPPA